VEGCEVKGCEVKGCEVKGREVKGRIRKQTTKSKKARVTASLFAFPSISLGCGGRI